MKTIKLLFLVIIFSNPCISFAQKKTTTYLGGSYAMETNIGFHGLMLNFEEEVKLKKTIQVLFGVNLFYSNNIPDRKLIGVKQFNKSVIADFCLQFKPNSRKENGLVVNFGPTMRFSDIRQITGYSINNGQPTDIGIREEKTSALGFKVGVGYKIAISEKLSSSIYLDGRFIDNIPETTFLNLGYKLGF